MPEDTSPPGRIDVEVDVALGVVRVEEQELGDDDVRHVVVDRRAEEHDAVHQQAAEDVVGALAPARALDDVRRVDRAHRHSRLHGGLGQQEREHLLFGQAALEVAQPLVLLERRLQLGRAPSAGARRARRSFASSSAALACSSWCSTTQSSTRSRCTCCYRERPELGGELSGRRSSAMPYACA